MRIWEFLNIAPQNRTETQSTTGLAGFKHCINIG